MGKENRSRYPAGGSLNFQYWVIISANIGLLVAGFAAAILMDYGYITTGAAHNPENIFRKIHSIVLLFPLCVFAVNWRLFRGWPLAVRLSVCLLLACLFPLIETLLLFTIGVKLHLAMGGGI